METRKIAVKFQFCYKENMIPNNKTVVGYRVDVVNFDFPATYLQQEYL